jgi:hypothetical protein
MPSASGWAGNWAAGRCLADKHLKELGLKAQRRIAENPARYLEELMGLS